MRFPTRQTVTEHIIRKIGGTGLAHHQQQDDLAGHADPSTRKRKAGDLAGRPTKARKSDNATSGRRRLPFLWRGRETGEGKIQLDNDKSPSNVGTLEFVDAACTRFHRLININLVGERVEFDGYRIGKGPKVVGGRGTAGVGSVSWEALSEQAYESERVGRWR